MTAQGNRTRAARRAAARPHLTCLFCGKDLRPHRQHLTVPRDQVNAVLAGIPSWQNPRVHADLRTLTPEASQRLTDQMLARIRTAEPTAEANLKPATSTITYFDALGDYGDNCFCGLNCGYLYAVAHTRSTQAVRLRAIATFAKKGSML